MNLLGRPAGPDRRSSPSSSRWPCSTSGASGAAGSSSIWALGMLFYGIGAGCEALGRGGRLERGAVPDVVPDRRRLDRRLARARAPRTCSAGRGSATASRPASSSPACSRSWSATGPSTPAPGRCPLLYFIAAGLLALAVAVETYFANDRWPILAAAAVVGATVLSIVLMATTTLPAPGYALDPGDRRAGRRRCSRRSSAC